MRRIGVLGGTFDPIHSGHLAVADEVCRRLDLSEVILAPAGEPWHKHDTLASGRDRLAMVRLAIAGHPRLSVTSVDIDRAGPTYTIDTLGELQSRFALDHPDEAAQWWFITGADALADFDTWRDPEGILARARLVGVTRPGHVLGAPDAFAGSVTLMEIPTPDVSSSGIRDRVASGQPIVGLVPDAVADYIASHHLYEGSLT